MELKITRPTLLESSGMFSWLRIRFSMALLSKKQRVDHLIQVDIRWMPENTQGSTNDDSLNAKKTVGRMM